MLLFSIRNLIRNIVNKYLVVNVEKEILSHHFYKHIPHCHPFIFSIPGNKIVCRNQKNIRMTGFRKSPFLKLLYGTLSHRKNFGQIVIFGQFWSTNFLGNNDWNILLAYCLRYYTYQNSILLALNLYIWNRNSWKLCHNINCP